jgi:UDP-N-acetylmuramoyl-tripeptide--D-alanyl-D-alanine ligase
VSHVPSLRIGELVEATGGSLVRGDPLAVVSTFAIDTRELQPGGLFFALPGSRTDGHAFLEDAARRGASAAVVQLEPGPLEPLPPAIVRVASTVEALASCGTLARDKARSLRVAAVTGSAGKTMTKEFLAAGLAPGHRVHRTAGNLNNHLGVPLTLLACPEDAEVAVIEMGMSGPGEIAALTRMARPAVGVITNVGPAHLQFFDSLDDIAAAKGELFALLGDEGIAVVNLDDEQLCVQAQRHAGPQVTFGRHPAADFRLKAVEDRFLPGATLTFVHQDQERRLELRIGGGHAARDALAAMAAVAAMRGDLDAAMEAMARVEPGPGRGRIHRLAEGIVVVDDSYNSNPPALQSVLRTLAGTPAEGRKVVVMGDMLELGREEIPLHKEAGRQIGAAGVALLFTVGALAQAAGESARRAGVPEVHHCADAAGAAAELPEWLQPGDLVVVKGSRRLRLEQVVEAVVGQRGGRA